MSEVTRILNPARHGDSVDAEALLLLVYEELRRLAAVKMAGEVPGQTLQPTALVHEVWLRLSQQADARWQNRGQFYAIAAETMRRILVDRARRRRSRKHGGDLERVEWEGAVFDLPVDNDMILRVHEALERLAAADPEKAEVVKLRFFVGLENGEVASLLGVSEKTVRRHWTFAKAWLTRTIREFS